jgi:hypothetical protein
MIRPLCSYPHHSMYMEREMRCPQCHRSGWQKQVARDERRKRTAETQLATRGIVRAIGDLIRHVWLFIKLQVHR